jgi:cysteine-rich repeat protein
MNGYHLVAQVCTNITGCITALLKNNAIVCAACNIMLKFILNNGDCECREGFSMQNGTCTEICGDGKLFTMACDDGNNINGDGCSSDCNV